MNRPPAVAGIFYSDDPAELRSDVSDLLEQTGTKKISSAPMALIVPHAGYPYSGLTAAHAYALLRNTTFDTVIIIAPSHQEYFPGISVYAGDSYETPLGRIPVNRSMRDELLRMESSIVSSVQGHRGEHSLEVQLPFLQMVLQKYSLLPIVMGDQKGENCRKLIRVLSGITNLSSALIIASSDLSHFHTYAAAKKIDSAALELVLSMDENRLIDAIDRDSIEACGAGPIAAVIGTAKQWGANRIEILHSCNSGDVTGDRNRVVGYMSAVLWSSQ